MNLIEGENGKASYSWSKVAVFVCFTLAATLLLNSLLHPNTPPHTSKTQSFTLNPTDTTFHDR